jgi:magnesium chelatase family protein
LTPGRLKGNIVIRYNMLAKVTSCALVGLDGATVEVEIDISPGLPWFTIVGLPDIAVQEARES